MIRESLYFSFDGRKSTDYPIVNVSVGTGAFEESVASGKTISETYPKKAFRPYFYGVQRNVKQFPLSFAFLEPWNDQMMEEVLMWLDTDEYKPLFFEANIDRVFYAMPIDDINLIHNGLKQGYLTLNIRCDSAYSYSHKISTNIYDCTKENSNFIEIVNRGRYKMLPNIHIEKIADGDITINNLTNKNQEMKISNIEIGEILDINCRTEIIKTNLENTHRYDDLNDTYLELVYGKNRLKISPNVKISFQYQYIYS